MGEDDEVLAPKEFNQLSKAEQHRIQKIVEGVQQKLQKLMRQFPVWQKEARHKVKALNTEITEFAVNHLLVALKEKYQHLPQVVAYLDAVQTDIIAHVDDFRATAEGQQSSLLGGGSPAASLSRYKVNVLMDQRDRVAAPILYEDLPSHANLIGRVEHQAHMGTLVTDFTMIKAGALHRANGGYLILDARKVLMQPYAWDTLKRTLQAQEIKIESLERTLSLISTASLEPEPIPLDVKVVLVGERLLYYLLNQYDPEFRELFKVVADFEETIDRPAEVDQVYASLIGTVASRNHLRPLDRYAVARVIEHAGRLAVDSEKLSAHLGDLSDLLREADHWRKEAGREVIAREDVQRAIDQQIYRSDRIRQRIFEEIRRGTILIDTQGEAVGQINGLSVIQLGKIAFGQPSRITATVRLGAGKVIDIERETDLGGPIHSKGVMILSSLLGARYAPDHPLSMSASLVFEQSYGMVEGDSASLAELCALLSALSGLPIRQSFGITGSVNQHGQVQPIGGVNEKVEGFFDVCKAAGLNGKQGVLIPGSNVKHLMLRQEVVEAAAAGRFKIYAVDKVDRAIELLTQTAAGERDQNGQFPNASVNGRVEQRMIELSRRRRELAREERDARRNGAESGAILEWRRRTIRLPPVGYWSPWTRLCRVSRPCEPPRRWRRSWARNSWHYL